MNNQKISIRKLSLLVSACIFIAASLNVIPYYYGIFTPDVLGDLLLFTVGYSCVLFALMGLHQSRLHKHEKLYDETTLMQLSKAYKSKMLNE